MFGLIPFADVVRRSFFQTVDGSFVGISNYVQVIKNDAFNLAAKNTLRFVVTCIPCLLLLSLILAMLLQQVLKTPGCDDGTVLPGQCSGT